MQGVYVIVLALRIECEKRPPADTTSAFRLIANFSAGISAASGLSTWQSVCTLVVCVVSDDAPESPFSFGQRLQLCPETAL
jgi:hypothetical protein